MFIDTTKSPWAWCRNLSLDAREHCRWADCFFGVSLSSSFCCWSLLPAQMRRIDYNENNKSKIVHKRDKTGNIGVNKRSKETRVICSRSNLNSLYSTLQGTTGPTEGFSCQCLNTSFGFLYFSISCNRCPQHVDIEPLIHWQQGCNTMVLWPVI